MQLLFGDCRLDVDRRELTLGAKAVAVGPQVFDLLTYLVQNREHVVSKDALLNDVWAGRIVSESTLASHMNAVRRAIGDSGEEQRWIRTVSRKGFRFVGDVREMHAPVSSPSLRPKSDNSYDTPEPALPLPDRPSVAVLPFLNLSGDSEQEYFTDGMVEDIIAALCHYRWLFVVARNSSFTYKGQAVDVKQVHRELGVRYVLEGSVRKSGDRLRVTGQLVDATTGANLWAERFESTLQDLFELQDQMAASVVGAVAPQLEWAEIQRAKRKPTGSLDAYDCYLRGMSYFHQATREAIDEALPLFFKAIELDADFSSAYGMAAWCLYWRRMNRWSSDLTQDAAEGGRLARRAVELGKNDAVALTRGGHALGHFGGDLDSCISIVDKALVLNPNFTAAWYLGGFQRVSRGDHDDAIEHFARAMRLSPLDPEMFQIQTGTAMAHLFAGRFDTAAQWAERASREMPDVLRVFGFSAASYALAGRTAEAMQAMQHVRRLDPTLRISNLREWVLLRRPDDFATLVKGLRGAGLPE